MLFNMSATNAGIIGRWSSGGEGASHEGDVVPKAEVAVANETKQQDFNLITNCMKIFAYVFRIKKKIRNYNKYEI